MKPKENDLMEKVVSLCKRRGFVFQGSEIYGGLAGTYDWGRYGVALKNNIKQNWWKKFVDNRRDMYGIDAAILMNSKVWEASGHVAGFLGTTAEGKKLIRRSKTKLEEERERCPECGGKLGESRQFNMMFATKIG